jgi:hypothetical protein
MAGTLTVSGGSSGLPSGQNIYGPLTTTGSSTAASVETQVNLVSGDNTVSVPTGAVAVWIVPPIGNTATILYRTSANSGDGGLPINPQAQTLHGFATSAPTSIILHASGSVAAVGIVFI